jgi:hypothetical protein
VARPHLKPTLAGQREVGCFVLANDTYLEWLVAFLESLRAFNPAMPVVVIPFDAEIAAVSGLRQRYGFEILDDASIAALDQIARALTVDVRTGRMFRRFASFWGPFDQFLVADADTLLLVDAAELVDTLETTGAELSYGMATNPEAVYRRGSLRGDTIAAGRAFVNAGAWCSRRGLFDLASFAGLAEAAAGHLTQFAEGTDQAFLNFCLLKSSVPIASWKSSPAQINCLWPGPRVPKLKTERSSGRLVLRDRWNPSVRVGMVHWAGMPLNRGLPYRRLWASYRYRGSPSAVRLGQAVADTLVASTWKRLPALRRLTSG